jgi:ankyrin repeat protein
MRKSFVLAAGAACILCSASLVIGGEIQDAIESGDIAVVQQLLSADKLHANASDENGTPPLSLAAQKGMFEIADILLGASAEVDAKDARGLTPLFWSVITGNRAMAELLVGRGADVTISHPVFGSAADFAFQNECQRGYSGFADFLISHGAAFDPNGVGPQGLTRLRIAVMLGSEDMVRWLIEKNVDVNAASPRDSSTALYWAAWQGYPGIVNMLIEAGADVNLTDSQGAPAIKIAAAKGHLEIVNRLIKAGAKLDFHDRTTGQRLLHLAALYGHKSIVETFLAAGADPGATDTSGNSPLDYACRYGHQQVADLLRQKGADEKSCSDRSLKANRADQKLANKEAVAWCLSNRGWAVRTQNHMLVFDAEEFGVTRPTEPSLSNGFVTPAELNAQNVVALYSCYHGNVGEPAYIHEIEDSLSNVVYVHNQDDPWRGPKNAVYLGPDQTTDISGVKLHTITPITSMPLLNYLCEVDGLVIYYAYVATDDIDKYRADLDSLALNTDHVDLAFLAVADESEGGNADTEAFIERLKPKTIILTDSGGRTSLLATTAGALKKAHPEVSIYQPTYPGDHVRYGRDGLIE